METPRRRRPQTVELLSLAFAIALVVVIGILAYHTWVDFTTSSEQVELSQQVTDGTNALLSSLKDAETGQRGFLLTGEDRYLDSYKAGPCGTEAARSTFPGYGNPASGSGAAVGAPEALDQGKTRRAGQHNRR